MCVGDPGVVVCGTISRTQLLSGEIQACVRIPTLIDPCHVYHDHNDDILYYHVIRLYMYICGKSYYTICIHDIVIEIIV